MTLLQIAAAKAASTVVPFFSNIWRPILEQSALSIATAARSYLPNLDEPSMT